jgi:hypothetical protein
LVGLRQFDFEADPRLLVLCYLQSDNGFQGDSNFGGLIVYATDNDGAGHNHSVNSGILDNLSQLYEAGYKVSLFKQALYFNIDGFYQTRIEAPTNTSGQRAQVHSRGLEVDLDYQPTKQFSFVSNSTYLLANYHQISSAFEQTGSYLDAFPEALSLMANPGPAWAARIFTLFQRVTTRCPVHRRFISMPTPFTRPLGPWIWHRAASHRRTESEPKRYPKDSCPGYLERRNLLPAALLGSASELLQLHERTKLHSD